MRDIDQLLPEADKKEWIPYLTYLDLRGFQKASSLYPFLNECKHVRFLFLESAALEALPFLEECQELVLKCPRLKALPSNLFRCKKNCFKRM